MAFDVVLLRTRAPVPYQAVANRAVVLDRLGMSASVIARHLGGTDKTVTKATRWYKTRQ